MVFPCRLGEANAKNGISLMTPQLPKELLQSLPSMLRIANTTPISSYSKAPGVFSSSCR
jgi:hypothetical protein